MLCIIMYKNKFMEDVQLNFMCKRHTTILKGIAIIFILLNHICQSYNLNIGNPLGPIGVCIFLITSGFGLNESIKRKGKKDYIKNRFKRVIVPYWIVILIAYFYLLPSDIITLIKYMLLITLPSGIYWYLILILFWYSAYFFVLPQKSTYKKIATIAVISIIFSVININDRKYIWQVLSFPVGIMLSEFNTDFILKKEKIIGITSIVISIISFLIKKLPSVNTFGVIDTLCQITLSVSASVFIIVLLYKLINLKVINIDYIGKISYELYLIHPLFLWIILKNKNILSLLIFLLITFTLSIIFNKLYNCILNKNIIKQISIKIQKE